MNDAARGDVEACGIIYYLLVSDEQIWLFTLFGKDESADLTTQQKGQLATAIDAELRSRAAARKKRRG